MKPDTKREGKTDEQLTPGGFSFSLVSAMITRPWDIAGNSVFITLLPLTSRLRISLPVLDLDRVAWLAACCVVGS